MADRRQLPQNIASFTSLGGTAQNRRVERVVENDDSSSSSSEGQSDSGSNSNSLNAFANDGGFLERFKQMQEACKQQAASQEAQFAVPQSDSADTTSANSEKSEPTEADVAATAKKRTLPFVGKRRGGKVLKTGVVHKPKVEDEEELPKDAWSRYLAEVRKYRERSCDDEEKTRPLVK
ncbi:telomerase RNA component interacting RNase [Rhipicephalus sanguineus]|uniref:telomerase RNA component interacting RNase n=1 Tax=Rhipicephalus sanguineus TaxID=34632 RepID=UPI001893BCDB|nr:telomerase RNA component interacting RNase [Rhipicephalus sanguineus]